MIRKQFTFYDSFYESISILPKYKQLEAYTNLIRYALFEEMPENLNGVVGALFMLQQPILDTARRKAIAGALGGKANGKQASDSQEETMPHNQE